VNGVTIKQLYDSLYERYKRKKEPQEVADEYVAFCLALTGRRYERDEAKIIVTDYVKRMGIKALIDACARYGLHPIKKQ